MAGFLSRIFGKKKESAEKFEKPDTTPDFPCPFGYKNAWYAIENETPETVVEKLNLNIVAESNWQDGIDRTYYSDDVFVSPQVNGFVLVVGLIGMTRNIEHEDVESHARQFAQLQYFGTHRVVEYHAWAKFADGKPIRAYAYLGESGEVQWDEGAITPEELELGFDKFVKVHEEFSDDTVFPSEEDVLEIAKAWGVDPLFGDGNYEKSTGYICGFATP